MDYGEFKQQVLSRIRDFLPEKYAKADISLERTVKTNDTVLDGIVIRVRENAITPNIYLNAYYDDYLNGRNMEDILRQISYVRDNAPEPKDVGLALSKPDFEFDKIKSRITCRMVNIELNRLFLADRPYTQMEDLAVVYDIQMGKIGNDNGSIPIKKSMQQYFGIDIKKLHRIAVGNMERLSPCICDSLINMAMGFLRRPDEDMDFEKNKMDESMFVLKDKNGIYGAAVALNDKVMVSAAERLGGDFYVLPSSIHDVIAVPKKPFGDFKLLEAMVGEINAAVVAPDEILSNHVYEYHAKERKLVRCDWAEERKASRSLSEGDRKKPSIKEQLAMPPVVGNKFVSKPGLTR